MSPLLLATGLLASLGLAAGEDASPWRVVGAPWEEACAGLAGVAPAQLATPPWPKGLAAWSEEAPWRTWVELVRAERAAGAPDPDRRLALALLARAQGRDADAWRHLDAVRGRPELLAAALPAFLPGARARVADGEPLPDGVLLAPALPPVPAVLPPGPWRTPEAEATRFRVGDAELSLRIALESDGTQIDLHHLAGGPVHVRVRVPAAPGARIGALYVDWSEVDDPDSVTTLELSAEKAEATLWGRFVAEGGGWPTAVPERLDAQLEIAGLQVVLPAEDPAFRPHRRFAEAVAELFQVPLEVADAARAGGPPVPDGVAPVVVRFREPGDGELAALVSSAEACALGLRSK